MGRALVGRGRGGGARGEGAGGGVGEENAGKSERGGAAGRSRATPREKAGSRERRWRAGGKGAGGRGAARGGVDDNTLFKRGSAQPGCILGGLRFRNTAYDSLKLYGVFDSRFCPRFS